MNYPLAQIILASRGDDLQGWMNILFIVILAVFWAVAGIVKAKARKSEPEDEGESPSQPARRPPTRGSTLREQLLRQFYGLTGPSEREPSAQDPKRPDTEAAATPLAEPAYADALRRAVQKHPAAQPPPELQSERPEAPVQTEIETPPAFRRNLATDLADQAVHVPAGLPQADELAELLLDYSDPEELRRAILHYEILGRPLSLRDSSAHTI